MMSWIFALSFLVSAAPTVTVTADNTVINTSCMIVIPSDSVIADTDKNGVIQVAADNITIEFAPDSQLQGCKPESPWDSMSGVGIHLDGHKNVTIKNARVHGYKVALLANDCDGLTIEGGDCSDNFRQHLRSTRQKEDESDWMSFHHNDNDEAMTSYGAAVYIKNAKSVAVHDLIVRRGQNGIVLSRVQDSKIYDNDCSFLSGWGLAMWRSSGNTVSRNRFDFCIRGYSDHVYNRGQDSAGIIVFEQCCKNTFAENSVTHGGDGFFSFAGLEALNGENAPKDFDFKRRGCNDNLLIDNDFSFSAAHGVEITFSFGNQIIHNRILDNAICGIWGGFSQQTEIVANSIVANGGMAYGLERGGINIDHSADNVIDGNHFTNNRCGIHLWWHPSPQIEHSPWGRANYRHVDKTRITDNTIVIDDKASFDRLGEKEKLIAIQLRDLGTPAGPNVTGVLLVGNEFKLSNPRAVELDATPGIDVRRGDDSPATSIPKYQVYGRNKPCGAHPELEGRDKIVMNEWGPTEPASPESPNSLKDH